MRVGASFAWHPAATPIPQRLLLHFGHSLGRVGENAITRRPLLAITLDEVNFAAHQCQRCRVEGANGGEPWSAMMAYTLETSIQV